jgi:hypothetical protein
MKDEIIIGDFEVRIKGSSRFPQPFIFHRPTRDYLTKNKKIGYPSNVDLCYYGNIGAAVNAVRAHYRRQGLPVPSYK